MQASLKYREIISALSVDVNIILKNPVKYPDFLILTAISQ